MALLHLESVPSTMDVARDLLLANPKKTLRSWEGVIADEQTQGRGQRGRTWFAPAKQSLCATYFFAHPFVTPKTAYALSLLAGVAAADSLQRALLNAYPLPLLRGPISSKQPFSHPSLPHDIGLKWPNDLLLNGRKVGGILVELAELPNGRYVGLIGVGMNLQVERFPLELAARATSLLLEGISTVTPQWMGVQVAISLKFWAERYKFGGLQSVLRRWRFYDRSVGHVYQYNIGQGKTVRGVAIGVDAQGALLLQCDDGTIQPCLSATSVQEIESP